MKNKIDFKTLDFSDIEFDAQKISEEDQKAFSNYLKARKANKLKSKNQIQMPLGI